MKLINSMDGWVRRKSADAGAKRRRHEEDGELGEVLEAGLAGRRRHQRGHKFPASLHRPLVALPPSIFALIYQKSCQICSITDPSCASDRCGERRSSRWGPPGGRGDSTGATRDPSSRTGTRCTVLKSHLNYQHLPDSRKETIWDVEGEGVVGCVRGSMRLVDKESQLVEEEAEGGRGAELAMEDLP